MNYICRNALSTPIANADFSRTLLIAIGRDETRRDVKRGLFRALYLCFLLVLDHTMGKNRYSGQGNFRNINISGLF
ncbi:hypothetical protein K435DRAFT_880451 [Dendrothele bispora CBS 962.96]|uniref:Uncharacterized protein n=1 Tax=Dendrothele bispora (strain CBS 962.96) TaxID=1314807 RepID=A0A4S8KKG7_DENBC|nr:hypothetical protein K435DRAFT_880451 [Dendrothele bispora CBS 962.96]